MKTRTLLLFGVIVAALLVAMACGAEEETTTAPAATAVAQPAAAATATPLAGSEKRGGEWRKHLFKEPPHWGIWELALIGPTSTATNNLVRFDPAIAQEGPDTILPALAKSWELSNNGKTYTFKLEEGVTFHDGTPFTSEHAAFTLEAISTKSEDQEAFGKKHGGTGEVLAVVSYQAWYQFIDEILTPDDYTLVVNLSQAQPSFLNVLSVEQAASIMNKGTALSEPLALRRKIGGTGPFQFESYDPGENWTVDRYPGYWDQPRPYLDRIVTFIIPSEGTAVSAFRAGQLDYMQIKKPEVVELVRADMPNTQIEPRTRLGFGNLFYNTEGPPFNNQKVRRAMSLVIDRKGLWETAFHGLGEWYTAAMPPGYWGLPDDRLNALPEFSWPMEQRISEAKKLLADAGYPDGFDTVAITWPGFMTEIAVFTQDSLKKIGINQEVNSIERAPFYEMVFAKDFEMASWTFGTKLNDPDGVLFEFYYCGSDRNYSDYCDRDISDKIEEQSAITDPAARRELVWDIQELIWESAFIPQLGWDGWIHMQSEEMRGWVPGSPHSDYTRQTYDTVWKE
jgi:peptide/nickel transport system substrate-binding protein